MEKALLPLTTIGKCSSLVELLPGLLKLEKGLCRGPGSAPRGMPPPPPPPPVESAQRSYVP